MVLVPQILMDLIKIVTFLEDFSASDTLKNLLNSKVDKESGKVLVDENYVINTVRPNYLNAFIDKNNKIAFGIKEDGRIDNRSIQEISNTLKSFGRALILL